MVVVTFPGISSSDCMASYQCIELATGPLRPAEGRANVTSIPRIRTDPPWQKVGIRGRLTRRRLHLIPPGQAEVPEDVREVLAGAPAGCRTRSTGHSAWRCWRSP